MLKTIIAGSRTITDYNLVEHVISLSGFNITEIVCGMARGVDMVGYIFAQKNNIPVKEFPADWSTGRSAGYRRNVAMGDYADASIIVWDNSSSGSKHMLNISINKKLKTCLYNTKTKELTFYNI